MKTFGQFLKRFKAPMCVLYVTFQALFMLIVS